MTATAPAGWYPEQGTGWLRYWDGALWTEHRMPPPAVPAPMSPWTPDVYAASGDVAPLPLGPRNDPWIWHFLRYLLIANLVVLTMYLLIGFVWLAAAFSATGRRKRDILMIFVPIWGTIALVQTFWRYTARSVYWSVRTDRPSKSLFSSR